MNKSSSQRPYKALGDELLRALGNRPQSWLAEQLYVCRVAVHNWVSGKRRPEPGRLGYIAAILDVPPDYLAHLAGYGESVKPYAFDKVMNAYYDRRAASSGKREAPATPMRRGGFEIASATANALRCLLDQRLGVLHEVDLVGRRQALR